MISEYESLPRFETIQNNFSLLNRRFEDELKIVCREHHVSCLPYSPLGGGVLSGKYAGGNWPDGARFSLYRHGGKRGETMTRRFVNEKTIGTTERVEKIAQDCEMSIVTFAMAWTLTREFVGSTIFGVTKVAQLDDILKAADVTLPDEAVKACDEITREILYPMG